MTSSAWGPVIHQTVTLFLTVGTDAEGNVAEARHCTVWTDDGATVNTTAALEDHQEVLAAGCEGGAVTYRLTPPADMRYRSFLTYAQEAGGGFPLEALAAHLLTLCPDVTILEETVMAPCAPDWSVTAGGIPRA